MAVAAFHQAAVFDPEEALGARLHLARLGAVPPPRTAPEGYVRTLFDNYAEGFDAHLVERLGYRGPDLLLEALARIGATRFSSVMDLGCGTGLCGAAFHAACAHLTGVDLSPRMVEAARRRGIYDRLETGSIDDFLARQPAHGANLVVAADVFVYFGELAPVFTAVKSVLEPDGLFAFTLQQADEGTYQVGRDMRYIHGVTYVEQALRAAELRVVGFEQASARKDGGVDVPGMVVVAACDSTGNNYE